ncbi:MAG: hypothetical protein ACI8PZ_002377 [Myxococcota bacterium]|jgi:hypothetical protein
MANSDDGRFLLGPAFAEGGMGRVHTAQQVALGRTVVVKVAHPPSRAAQQALEREARVTGLLDHPAVVPVHDLVVGADGPMLVMKRLTGPPWALLLRDPGRVDPLLEGGDALSFHLGVLAQVCRAVQYAHERGVLHLDLKPGNVMVGEHGEVTLLDWGLAASLDGEAGLPPARDRGQVVGTPSTMSPEQARGEGARLGVGSDVFALGAMLYQVLAGAPRFDGLAAADQLEGAQQGVVPHIAAAPAELAALLTASTATDPAHRTPSADAFRRALGAFGRHRSAVAMSDAAEARVARLTEVVADGDRGEPMNTTAAHRALVEARFGFRHALAEWPEHPTARAGHDRALALGTRFELLRGNPLAAEQLLGEMRSPDPALLDAIATQRARLERERRDAAELKALKRASSPQAFAPQRAVVGVFMSLVVLTLCVWLAAKVRFGVQPLTYPTVFGPLGLIDLAVLFSLGVVWSVGRLNAFALAHSRYLLALTALLNAWWFLAWIGDVPLPITFAVHLLAIASAVFAVAATFDALALPTGLCFGAGFVATMLWPSATLELFALANTAGWLSYTLSMVWLGRR